MNQQESQEPAAKLNIFALPNQATILFSLIVTVLLGAIILGSIGRMPIPVWPITVILLFLSCRAFLQHPEKSIAGRNISIKGNEFDLLQKTIDRLAEKLGLLRAPILIFTSRNELYTLGTFRRWYIVIGEQHAETLKAQLQDTEQSSQAEAKLLHELYHFQTGDYWQMNYAQQLLRYTFLILGWAIFFFLGFGLLLFVAGPDVLQLDFPEIIAQTILLPPDIQQILIEIFPSVVEMEEVRLKAREINLLLVLNFVFNAFFPFIIIAGILRLFYWPKFWRMREVYADAGVVKTQNETESLLVQLSSLQPGTLQGAVQIIKQSTPNCSLRLTIREWWRRGVRGLTKKHYDTDTRIDHVVNPANVFGCWFDTAVPLGFLVLLLDILLASTLTLLYIGNWPMHFSTTVIFIFVSLSLIPELVLGRSGWSYMFKTIGVVIGFRLIWILLTISCLFALFFVAPNVLADGLAAAVAGVARYAGYSTDIYFEDLGAFVVGASIINLAQVFVIFLLLSIALTLIIAFLRRLLSWYSLPNAEKRLMKVAYAIVGTGVLFLIFTILPIITAVLLEPTNLLNPVIITLAVFGTLVTTVAFLFFWQADRRYANYCPHCHKSVTGPFILGKRCDSLECGELLHSWLIAGYEL